MNYKLHGTKFWKSHFRDLKCFDRISFIDIISRIDFTLKEFKEYKSGALIQYKEEYANIPEMKELYDTFNKENSTKHLHIFVDTFNNISLFLLLIRATFPIKLQY